MQVQTRRRHPKPTPQQNAGRLLRHAAQILMDRGWVRKVRGNPDTGFCAMGAIGYADPQNYADAGLYFGEWLVTHGYISLHYHGIAAVVRYNDGVAPSGEHVAAAMILCAYELDPLL